MAARRSSTDTFETVLTRLPYTANTERGRGFLPPLARSVSHVLNIFSSPDDGVDELSEANLHLSQITGLDNRFSEGARVYMADLTEALRTAQVEYPTWEGDTRTTNLRNLANRMVGVLAMLDREVLGITDSDAGYNL